VDLLHQFPNAYLFPVLEEVLPEVVHLRCMLYRSL
jgi:hypothetical protein